MITNFAKLHSSGNNFIVCFDEDLEPSALNISLLCDKNIGISADGVIIIKKNLYNYSLSFYNNNGSQFKMCFNGALCAAKYLSLHNNLQAPVQLHIFDFGIVLANYYNESIALSFKPPTVKIKHKNGFFFGNAGTCYDVHLTDNHKLFLPVDDILHSELFLPLAKKFRTKDDSFEDGSNVHFAYVLNNSVYIRHFEKGVERETPSCGSGCVAAAIVLAQYEELDFISPGGKLKIIKENNRSWELHGHPQLVAWLQFGENMKDNIF